MSVSETSFAPTSSFNRDIPLVSSLVDSSIQYTGLPELGSRDTANIIAEYVSTNQNPFGAAEWKQHFGVDVGPETPFEEGFDEWWNGPDPVDIFNNVPNPRLVSETHLRPVFAPRFFKDIQEKTFRARSLGTLKHLGLEFLFNLEDQLKQKKGGHSCWLVMRKDVLEDTKNKTWSEQQKYLTKLNRVTGAGYEEEPSIIDLATVILPHKIVDGERHLGDNTGAKGYSTFSRVREMDEYKDFTGRDRKAPWFIGGFPPSGAVHIGSRCGYITMENLGVAALRKFY